MLPILVSFTWSRIAALCHQLNGLYELPCEHGGVPNIADELSEHSGRGCYCYELRHGGSPTCHTGPTTVDPLNCPIDRIKDPSNRSWLLKLLAVLGWPPFSSALGTAEPCQGFLEGALVQDTECRV